MKAFLWGNSIVVCANGLFAGGRATIVLLWRDRGERFDSRLVTWLQQLDNVNDAFGDLCPYAY